MDNSPNPTFCFRAKRRQSAGLCLYRAIVSVTTFVRLVFSGPDPWVMCQCIWKSPDLGGFSAAGTEHRLNGLSPIFTTLICAGHGLTLVRITIQQPIIHRMETFSGSIRSAGCQTTPRRVSYLVLVLGAAMFIAGCGRKTEPLPVSPTPPPPQANQDAVPPVSPGPAQNPQPAPGAPATNAATAPADLQSLNQQLIRWVVQNHQRPKSFEDFVARANIQVPPPPAGKKYVIDKRGFVALVDSSTK